MYKFELKQSGIVEGREIKFFQNDFYEIEVNRTFIRIAKLDWNDKYLPDLSIIKKSFKDKLYSEVTIQTASYGSLNVEGINKIIDGLNVAKESVKEAKKLLKELNLME